MDLPVSRLQSCKTNHDWLTLVGDRGDIRTVELTPAVNIKLAERDSADQVGAYLGLLASTRAPDRRRMTISTAGTGERDLLVGYVSEMPIWKTTYRLVLSPDGEPPLLQGWAIVDNTTGEDWAEVELSRLLSYAVDLGVQIESQQGDDRSRPASRARFKRPRWN